MKYTHVFWDFNGTLYDDVDAGIQSINVLLSRRGKPTIADVDGYRSVFGFPIIDYYRRVGFDFSEESYADVAVEWVRQYNIYSQSSRLYPSAEQVLQSFRAAGLKQVILTASEYNMVCGQLKSLGIFEYFDDILGLDNIHAYSKEKLAVDYIKKERPQKAVLIGDTTHDSDVASAAGIDCILVCHGHQSSETLGTCRRECFANLPSAAEYILHKQ